MRNPRVKKKKAYAEKLKKLKSMKAVYKGGEGRGGYAGELTGIKPGLIKSVKKIEKDDLNMPNHLLGYKRTFLELRFSNVQDLMAARRDIMPIAEKNKKNLNAMDTYAEAIA